MPSLFFPMKLFKVILTHRCLLLMQHDQLYVSAVQYLTYAHDSG